MINIRNLQKSDFSGFINTIAALSMVTMKQQEFEKLLLLRKRQGINTIVAENLNEVVGTASYFIETKFLHNGGKVMHIEDVAVRQDLQKQGVGKSLLNHLNKIAIEEGCYKIILDASDENVVFYEKCGYHAHEIEMRKDLV